MNVSPADIERRLRTGEDSRCEFKQIEFSGNRPVGPSRNDLADEITAFANTDGGTILCGVTDAGDVQDLSREQLAALDRLLGEVCTDTIHPPVRILTDHCETTGGRLVLMVSVPKGEFVHQRSGKSYLRVGDSKRLMETDEALRLAQLRSQARTRGFDEQVVPGTGFGTLEPDLWKPLLSAEGASDPEASLEKLGILSGGELKAKPATVAGVLLCTLKPDTWLPCACIDATFYRGTDRSTGQVDAQTITGPLSQQITQAALFVMRNMRVAALKVPARIDLPEYDDRAVFEALVNAVVHRDYSIRGSRIRVSMFAGRLEIQSPGSLPNNLTVDTIATRQVARNQVLASIMGRVPVNGTPGSKERQYFMERRGDGVPIIRRMTRELTGKLPEYSLIDGSEVLLKIHAMPQEMEQVRTTITVRCGKRPAVGVDLLVLFPNTTSIPAKTDDSGEATIELYTNHLPMTVFAAAPNLAAAVERDWTPAERDLVIEMRDLPEGGAMIIREGTGKVPGLDGTISPIRDPLDRTYIYTSNIAVNQGKQQPVHFVLGEELRLTDVYGREENVRIADIEGRSSLVEYRHVSQ